jgi:hypothetical protein
LERNIDKFKPANNGIRVLNIRPVGQHRVEWLSQNITHAIGIARCLLELRAQQHKAADRSHEIGH